MTSTAILKVVPASVAQVPPSSQRRLRLTSLILLLTLTSAVGADDFPAPVNTQAAGEHPPSPTEMLSLFELPPGFNVTLFAGEPDVQQPIAFDFDDRGRIWVAENYTYSARGKIDAELRDRIIILHDRDGDGQHDERTIFWDRGRMLTSLTWGFGGLWILNDGTLSFIPDKDGDDVPDSEPVELLNGWTMEAGHNFVNGLLWGPDGWLYGRHGITETSYPGTPDTPVAERQPMNCGVWRFHPSRHTFEIVCHGTTNPWGLDYNEHGQMFMTNNVIGHLWHVVPGAHYERMFGQDFNPHLYELMPQTADHYHWDHSGRWVDSRDGKADALGGGHSHCGGMIYLGDNFPPEYRGRIFMCNTHGRCVNVDRLERHGSGYVARHEPNFLKVNTPWFRGVELKYGPRGCVYLTDWSDYGECHDHDGVHRTSGRIYRISYGTPKPLTAVPLVDMSEAQKIQTAISGDEWHARRARRLLQQGGWVSSDNVQQLAQAVDGPHAVKALQLLSSIDRLDRQTVVDVLQSSDNEHVVASAVQLGVEHGFFLAPPTDPGRAFDQSPAGNAKPLVDLCDTKSSFVLLNVASALQRIDERARRMVARKLVPRLMEFPDRNLLLMTWYGLLQEPSAAGLLYVLSDNLVPPGLLQFVARRVIQMDEQSDVVVGQLLSPYGPAQTAASQVAVLKGLQEGLRGQHKPTVPAGWNAAQRRFSMSDDEQIVRLTQQLSVLFGDGAALSELRTLIADRDGDHAARSQAVAALGQAQDAASLPVMLSLLTDRAVYVDVARALAAFDDPRIPEELLKRWDNLRHGSREAALDTLCSRRSYALELTRALADGRVDGSDLTAVQVRQLLAFNDPGIAEIIEDRWGVINDSSASRASAIEHWTAQLTPETLAQADPEVGAALFKKTCAACHKLYGEGGSIGPDLTGANRGNLDYVLTNVIDPSQVVPRQFTVSVIALLSGRVITGVVIGETEAALTVQTDKEQLVIAKQDIEEQTRTTRSLMPDGLLDPLTEEQVRDLIAFVMKRRDN
ncbi:MAG: c-type cytochrome [Fuerstiella sp.]